MNPPANRRTIGLPVGPASRLRRLTAALTGHAPLPAGPFALAARWSATGL
jgi:hypothetical protein